MAYRDILYQPGAVTRIVLNRPQYRNAQTPRMIEELDDAFQRAVDDRSTRVIVLSGAGDHFSAGHDVGTPEAVADRAERGFVDEPESRYVSGRGHWYEASMRWRNLPLPTIAMVHGYCIFGGWIVASAMDLVFAANDALFLPAQLQYFAVPWDLGARKAKELLYEGRFLPAAEARALGFVNRVFAPAELERETLSYAARVAEGDRFSNRMVKFSVNNMQDQQGFTANADAAFQTFYINASVAREVGRAEPGRRRLPGVARVRTSEAWFPEAIRFEVRNSWHGKER